MSMTFKLGATLSAMLLATSAFAETSATAYTDLNLRAGPGVNYEILSVIPASQAVTVDGCLEASNWCRVAFGEVNGWASGDYLTAMVEAPIYENRQRLAVETITYEKNPDATIGGGVTGAIAGGLLGGPVGAVIGAGIGMGLGTAAAPSERVTTYVMENPVDPIYLDGEIVVGAGIPEEVTLTEVPESEYYYAYVNGTRVLVEREQRRVVYIVR
ncbi:DUF1236 domain-containing protein [Roseinatronobacter monicus]|uniref:DUF1236 domain-containing protein n=1 Tax=Roseinatronobacter monicus TaxID=393481 RepID=UPI003F3112F5